MPRKTLQLQFPRLGVVRRSAYMADRRAPYPTPWAVNVRLQGTLSARMRGGSWDAVATVSELLSWDTMTIDDWNDLTFDQWSTLAWGVAHGSSDGYVYRDRAITFSDGIITAARQGDSTDTTLSADVSDTARPTIFQLAEADATGDDVVALVPHKDSFLLCFTATETWVFSGDPATGTLRRVSDEVGIIAETAWCVAHDTVYFLSSRGLYSVGADGSGLKALSEDWIPEDLSGVSDSSCVLIYNHADRGVYIHLTDGVSWFYDTERQQFWPFTQETDDSHVLLGPLRLGGVDSLGLIQAMHGMIGIDSGTVTWAIVHGTTAEEAAANGKAAITAALAGNDYSSYVRGSGSWGEGRSQTARPRVSAMWACVWLSATAAWSFEGISLGIEPGGAWRK